MFIPLYSIISLPRVAFNLKTSSGFSIMLVLKNLSSWLLIAPTRFHGVETELGLFIIEADFLN